MVPRNRRFINHINQVITGYGMSKSRAHVLLRPCSHQPPRSCMDRLGLDMNISKQPLVFRVE